MAGAKVSLSSDPSRNRKQPKGLYVESTEYKKKEETQRQSQARSSRRARVHPEARRSRAMDDADKSSKRISVQTGSEDVERSSPTVRGSKDWRSPGAKMTPVANSASRGASDSQAIPDFITQTDANGNAVTPRSAAAINNARKGSSNNYRSNVQVDPKGKLPEDHSDDQSEKDQLHSSDDPCDMLLESLRMMCCCFMDDMKPGRTLTGQATQESDDRPRLLGDLHPDDVGKKCLVLDLDETLVHSSFRAVPNADFVIPVQIEDVVHFVYVAKRPGVDEFLVEMAKHYEIVIYTASLNKYADPLLDLLDPKKVIRTRLFRESCVYYEGNYVKDLSLLDRDLRDTIIIDNSPSSYLFHPENAIDCSSFIDDPRDRELDQIGAFLKGIKDIKDVRGICPQWRNWPSVDINGQNAGKAQ